MNWLARTSGPLLIKAIMLIFIAPAILAWGAAERQLDIASELAVPVHRLFPVTISGEIHTLDREPSALYFSIPARQARWSTVE